MENNLNFEKTTKNLLLIAIFYDVFSLFIFILKIFNINLEFFTFKNQLDLFVMVILSILYSSADRQLNIYKQYLNLNEELQQKLNKHFYRSILFLRFLVCLVFIIFSFFEKSSIIFTTVFLLMLFVLDYLTFYITKRIVKILK